jgi:DNA (cytosine-5)-methyltransferase 1
MGAECVFSSEIDKHSIAVYEENFGEKPSGDITKINPNDIPDHDILCAGFPCQPFSIAGKQEGFADLTRGTIFYDILKIVKVKKPQVIFLENVANLEAHDNGNTFNIVKSSIEELGYSFNYSVMNALDYGVPQNRKRIYIVAFRNDVKVNNFEFPEPITLTKHVEDILEPESYIAAKMYVNRTDVVMNSKDLNSYSVRPIQIGHVAANRQGERIYSIKGTAITLTANGGGQFSKTGGYLINDKLRKLTPRECARLMGFPDDFIISKSNNQAYTQFGNSVVVDVIQMILESIAEALCDGEDKNNKEINDFSTLKKEYNNPVKNNFSFLSYFKVVDVMYIIREFVDKIINKLLSIRLYYKDTAGHTHKNLNLI